MKINSKIQYEQPLFTLRNVDYDNRFWTEIYATNLANAKIGDVFEPKEQCVLCKRGVIKDKLTVIYRFDNKVVCLLETYETSDTANPEEYFSEEVIVFALG